MLDLITDRTTSDVANGTKKGYYNAEDLNRVTEAMEYLNDELRKAGCESGYFPVIVHPQETPPQNEEYDEHTLLLLHGSEFLDSSKYGVAISNNGVQAFADQGKLNAGNFYFDGASFFSVTSPNFIFHDSDFTIEWWEYRENDGSLAAFNVFSDENKSNFLISHMDGESLYGSSANKNWDMFSQVKCMGPKKNQWSHKALVRMGSKFYVYVDGKKTYESGFTFSLDTGTGKAIFGRHAADANPDYFVGYICEIRVSDIARFSGEFTPQEYPYSEKNPSYGEVKQKDLPEGYTPLEYIDGSGTQFVDTEFYADSDTRICADFQFLVESSSEWLCLFSARDVPLSNNFSFWKNPSGGYRTDFGTDQGIIFGESDTNRHFVDKNKNVTNVDGVTAENPFLQFSGHFPVYIFGTNDGGTATILSEVRIFSVSVYRSGVLMRYFIPCKNNAGSIGLFDPISARFYQNSGTGEFIAGPEIVPEPEPEPLDQYTWYETDEPNRSQMEQYLANVQKIRSALSVLGQTPSVPESMRFLNYEKANDIEKILLNVETVLTNMLKTVDLGWALGIAHTGLYGGV